MTNTYYVLTITIIFIQIGVAILNIGALFAYFQRNRLSLCKDLASSHILRAALWGWAGILTFPGIFLATERFRYGLKFTKNEFEGSEWWELVEKEHRKRDLAKIRAKEPMSKPPEGRCVDIWEDLV